MLIRVRVAQGSVDLARGAADDPVAVLASDTVTLPQVLWRGLALEEAERAGALAIEGSRRAARRFLPPVEDFNRGQAPGRARR